MTALLLGYASVKRSLVPESLLLNCLSEKSPTKPSAPESLFARPGLEAFTTVGTAPFRGVFQRAGLLGDAMLIVASTTAYLLSASGALTTLTGTIAGDGLVEIDGGTDQDGASVIRIATGSALYKYVSSGTGFVAEDFPTTGGAGATSVAYFFGYWVAVEADTDYLYYIEPAGASWNALQFAAAEYGPDKLKGVRVSGGLLWMLGSATTEAHRLTGDSSSPIEKAGGLEFDMGCRSIDAAANCGGTLIWVTDKCKVVLTNGGEPRTISDNGLSEQIRQTAAADLSAGFYDKDQHPCYVLHLGTSATWVFDLSTERWTRFSSLGLNYWRPRLFANIGETVICTDRGSNQVWRLDPDRRTDGDDVFPVRFPAFLDVPEGMVDVANLELDCLTGDAPLTGQGSAPQVGMRYSRDGAKTWSSWRYRSLGSTGDYDRPVRWNALGMAKAPHGLVFDFLISDPVGRRVSAARINTP